MHLLQVAAELVLAGKDEHTGEMVYALEGFHFH